MSDDCVFCKISLGIIPSKKLYENDSFFVISDINPIADGHILVISKKHYENILTMPVSLGMEFLEAIKNVSETMIKEHGADGFNVILNTAPAAGQIVFHVHAHIIPRKDGDGLKILGK